MRRRNPWSGSYTPLLAEEPGELESPGDTRLYIPEDFYVPGMYMRYEVVNKKKPFFTSDNLGPILTAVSEDAYNRTGSDRKADEAAAQLIWEWETGTLDQTRQAHHGRWGVYQALHWFTPAGAQKLNRWIGYLIHSLIQKGDAVLIRAAPGIPKTAYTDNMQVVQLVLPNQSRQMVPGEQRWIVRP